MEDTQVTKKELVHLFPSVYNCNQSLSGSTRSSTGVKQCCKISKVSNFSSSFLLVQNHLVLVLQLYYHFNFLLTVVFSLQNCVNMVYLPNSIQGKKSVSSRFFVPTPEVLTATLGATARGGKQSRNLGIKIRTNLLVDIGLALDLNLNLSRLLQSQPPAHGNVCWLYYWRLHVAKHHQGKLLHWY